MISLLVEDYCHRGCKAFEADVQRPETYFNSAGDEIEFAMDTNVRCAKRNLCKQLMRYLNTAKECK